jgi:hypothetical protein
MRRSKAWWIALALLATLPQLATRAAELPSAGTEVRSTEVGLSAPWYRRIFSNSEKSKHAKEPVAEPLPPAVAIKSLAEEQAAYLQRLAVCTRLREIAVYNDNEDLVRQVDQLERQATELYHRKVSTLPSNRLTPVNAEARLDRELGSGIATNPLQSAAKRDTAGKARKGQASAQREVRP